MSERRGAAVPGLSEATEDPVSHRGTPWNPWNSIAREGAAPKAPRSEQEAQ
jgi:hypothetical protein